MLEFFTNKLWCELPQSWQKSLSQLSPPDLVDLLIPHHVHNKSRCNDVLPLSLIAFQKCTYVYSFSRLHPNYIQQERYDESIVPEHFESIFQKHLSRKKKHEIDVLSKVIENVYKRENCSAVIDVGSGQGHLSRVLGFGYTLPVIGIEHENSNLKSAAKFDKEINCKQSYLKSGVKPCIPIHIQSTILADVKQQDFFLEIQEKSCSRSQESEDTPSPNLRRCLLTGLHACGDLSATMIRLFKESDRICAIVSVACCYIKLTTDGSSPSKQFKSKTCVRRLTCYPMSTFTKTVPYHQLSYQSLKLACHGLEDFSVRLSKNDSNLKVQCYRAVLEYLLRKRHPTLLRPAVKTIKNTHLLSFSEYATIAFKRLNLDVPNAEELACDDINEKLKDWNKVIVLFTLSLMLGPVIETIILLDRMIYLAENGFCSNVFPVFNPFLSPRCFALVAFK